MRICGSLVVTKINDVPINSIADIDDGAAKTGRWFSQRNRVRPEFPKLIYLDAKEVEAEAGDLMKNYGLHAPSTLINGRRERDGMAR